MEASMSATAVSPETRSRGWHWTLWVLQVVLAAFFAMAGYSHSLAPFDEVVKRVVWMKDLPLALVKFIGVAELLGAIGLILPAATRVKPGLTIWAAIGVGTIMVLAIPF